MSAPVVVRLVDELVRVWARSTHLTDSLEAVNQIEMICARANGRIPERQEDGSVVRDERIVGFLRLHLQIQYLWA